MTFLRVGIYPHLNRGVALVVIDSVAAALRYRSSNVDERSDGMQQHNKRVQELVAALRGMIAYYAVAIVCTNQVSDIIGVQVRRNPISETYSKRPALGHYWSEAVGTSMRLRRRLIGLDSGVGGTSNSRFERHMDVVYSPFAPVASRRIEIADDGIQVID